jgi:hypothetical protein
VSTEAGGVHLTARRRPLGILQRATWTAVSHGHAQHTAARIDSEIRPHAYGRPAAPPSPRTVHLVALAHAAGLTGRLYPGQEYRDTHRYIEYLATTHTIAQAAHHLIEQDTAVPPES